RLGGLAGEALATGQVVERRRVLGIRFDDLAASPGGLGVVAAPIQVVERLPELPAGDLIRLTGDGSDRQDRRSRLLRECRALHAGTGEDERAGRRIQLLAAELESRAAFEHQVELLLGVVAVVLV